MRPVIVRHLRPRVQSFVGLQSVEYLDAIMTGMDLELLRVQVYRTFAGTGRAPTVADLAESVQGSPAEVQEGLQQLARNRHVVLDAAGAIVMAHPFSAVPLGFSAMSVNTLWWGDAMHPSASLRSRGGPEDLFGEAVELTERIGPHQQVHHSSSLLPSWCCTTRRTGPDRWESAESRAGHGRDRPIRLITAQFHPWA